MQLTWQDPAAGIAALLLAIVGALLLRGQAVPDQLWAAAIAVIGFLFGGHASLGGGAQVYKALNGSAGPALAASTHASDQAVASATAAATQASPPSATSVNQAGPLP